MDCYFEVGELEFPAGAAERWLATVLPETDRDDEDRRTVEELFRSLEGDVDTSREEDRFRTRIVLIDGFYFQDQDALGLMLDAAATARATGVWYSGSEQSGDRSTFQHGRRKVASVDAESVWSWIGEAAAVAERNAQVRAAGTTRPAARATAAKPRAAKPSAAKPHAAHAAKPSAAKPSTAKPRAAKASAANAPAATRATRPTGKKP